MNLTKFYLMIRITLLLMLISVSSIKAQTIEFSAGRNKSSLDLRYKPPFNGGKNTFYLLPEPYSSYNFELGIEYLSRKYFSVFSSIGINEIGGSNSNNPLSGSFPKLSSNKDAILKNIVLFSSVRIKSTNEFFSLFLEIGPKISHTYDTNESFKDTDMSYEGYNLDLNYSINFGSGIYKDINKLRLGIKYNYQYYLNSFTKDGCYIDSTIKSSSINLSIGYNL